MELTCSIITSLAGVVAKYCNENVCVCVVMCVSVCEDISGTARAIFTKFFVHIACGHGLVLRRCCNMLVTSSFVDDIIFLFCNGPYEFCYEGLILRKFTYLTYSRQNLIYYY